MMTLHASSPLRLTIVVVATLMAWLPGGARLAHAAAGDLDPTFGSGGKVITDLGGPVDTPFSVAVQSDGRILVAGYSGTYFPDNFDFALVRYTTNGSLDSTFGTGGKVTTDFGTIFAQANSIAVQSDGNIVVVGGSVQSRQQQLQFRAGTLRRRW